jgi:hypothetical protein
MVSRFIPLLPVAILAGCAIANAGSQLGVEVPITGGATTTVHFHNGNAVNAETADVRIEKAFFNVESKDLSGRFVFGFVEKTGDAPRSVKVEDVKDDKVVTWVDDGAPRLKNGHWEATTERVMFEDRRLGWLREIDPSVRIFRFTIVRGDGSTVVLDEPAVFSPGIKEFIKKQLDAASPGSPAAP